MGRILERFHERFQVIFPEYFQVFTTLTVKGYFLENVVEESELASVFFANCFLLVFFENKTVFGQFFPTQKVWEDF